MMESEPNLIPDNPNVKAGPISIADLTMHVMQQKAANQFYDPKTDEVLIEWSKKGKFTLATFSPSGIVNLIFNKGEVYEVPFTTRKGKSKSKFFPKNRRN